MLLIPCPYCGERGPQVEFAYRGDATRQRPPDGAPDEVWYEYVFLRDNPRGPHREWWLHHGGCGRWIRVTRDTATHEVLGAEPAVVPPDAGADDRVGGGIRGRARDRVRGRLREGRSVKLQRFRNLAGGLIDRDELIEFTFDGRPYFGYRGDTLASALLAHGVRLFGRSFKYHRPRGVMAAGAEEPNALVTVGEGARAEPNLRATQVEIESGMTGRSQNRWPSLAFDLGAAAGLASPLFPSGFYYKTFMWPSAPAGWLFYERFIRRAAGLGRGPVVPDPDRYDKTHDFCDVLVVGGGPAGPRRRPRRLPGRRAHHARRGRTPDRRHAARGACLRRRPAPRRVAGRDGRPAPGGLPGDGPHAGDRVRLLRPEPRHRRGAAPRRSRSAPADGAGPRGRARDRRP